MFLLHRIAEILHACKEPVPVYTLGLLIVQ